MVETTRLDSVQELFESTETDKTTNKGEREQIFSHVHQSVCGVCLLKPLSV